MNAKQLKKIHIWIRAIIQLLYFIFIPSVYTAAFAGVKYIFTQIGAGEKVALTSFVTVLIVVCVYTAVFGRFFCGFACGRIGRLLWLKEWKALFYCQSDTALVGAAVCVSRCLFRRDVSGGGWGCESTRAVVASCLYNAFTPSPRLPNAQANPQKNLPKTAVYTHTTISTVTNDVSATFSPAPICVNIYFTPANAAVYTDGIKIKYSNWMIALIHICIFFNCFAFIYFTALSNACFVAFLIPVELKVAPLIVSTSALCASRIFGIISFAIVR